MYVLCDTSSILMLIRIAPAMFTDARFNCVTLPEIREELYKTARFKSRYPWIIDYRKFVNPLTTTELADPEYRLQFSAVKMLVEAGAVNERTNKPFNLSDEDGRVVAFAATKKYEITTGDKNLIDFAEQQFSLRN